MINEKNKSILNTHLLTNTILSNDSSEKHNMVEDSTQDVTSCNTRIKSDVLDPSIIHGEKKELSSETILTKENKNNLTDATSCIPISANYQLKDFNPYPYSIPDPLIHGSGQFVAALPAQPRIEPGPQLEQRPMWHSDAAKVGVLYNTDSIFIKQRKGGSISLIYEQQLRQRGIHGYTYTVVEGCISASDGVGFVFADRVPCSKNIKRLWSVFVNRTGHIVKRMGNQMDRQDYPQLPPLALGQVLSIVIDLNQFRAVFQVKKEHDVIARSHIDLSDMAEKIDGSRGYLCAAVTKADMVVGLNEAPIDLFDSPTVLYIPDHRDMRHRWLNDGKIDSTRLSNSSNFYDICNRSPNKYDRYLSCSKRCGQVENVSNSYDNWERQRIAEPHSSFGFNSSQSTPYYKTVPETPQHVLPFASWLDNQVEDYPRNTHHDSAQFNTHLGFQNRCFKNESEIKQQLQQPNSSELLTDERTKDILSQSLLDTYLSAHSDTLPNEYSLNNSCNIPPPGFKPLDLFRSKSIRHPIQQYPSYDPASAAWDTMRNCSTPDPLDNDPAILSVSNRGLSTSSNSSQFVGLSQKQLSSQSAALLLTQLRTWFPSKDLNSFTGSETMSTEINGSDLFQQEDTTSCLLPPLLELDNRTVSAPPTAMGTLSSGLTRTSTVYHPIEHE